MVEIMKKRIPLIVSLLAFGMVFASVSRASATTLSPPSWVPSTVSGWTLGYNGTLASAYNISIPDVKVVSNWTQVWYELSSSTVNGIIGVIDIQYAKDYFSQTLSSKALSVIAEIEVADPKLGKFTGSTAWDFLAWIMNIISIDGDGTNATDETSNIAGSTHAVSLNLTFGAANFYLLYAYAGPEAMCVFGLTVKADFSSLSSTAMYTYTQDYLYTIYTLFSIFLFITADFGVMSSGILATTAVTPQSVIAPATKATTATNETTVNNFASTYVTAVAATNNSGSSLPGYVIPIVGITAVIAVFLIYRKKKMVVA